MPPTYISHTILNMRCSHIRAQRKIHRIPLIWIIPCDFVVNILYIRVSAYSDRSCLWDRRSQVTSLAIDMRICDLDVSKEWTNEQLTTSIWRTFPWLLLLLLVNIPCSMPAILCDIVYINHSIINASEKYSTCKQTLFCIGINSLLLLMDLWLHQLQTMAQLPEKMAENSLLAERVSGLANNLNISATNRVNIANNTINIIFIGKFCAVHAKRMQSNKR